MSSSASAHMLGSSPARRTRANLPLAGSFRISRRDCSALVARPPRRLSIARRSRMTSAVSTGLLTYLALVPPCTVSAQIGDKARSTDQSELRIDGPPAPVLPAVINRDQGGRATIRAIRLDEPMRLDGRLDESVYQDVAAISGFLQTLPDEGQPATERTEAWITFDADNVYVSARMCTEHPDRKAGSARPRVHQLQRPAASSGRIQ